MTQEVSILAGRVTLPGSLEIPEGAPGVVLFAHGSGSSRFSPRNRYVAAPFAADAPAAPPAPAVVWADAAIGRTARHRVRDGRQMGSRQRLMVRDPECE